MAMKFHPDKSKFFIYQRYFIFPLSHNLDSSEEAEQKFKEINAANEILSDPQKVRLITLFNRCILYVFLCFSVSFRTFVPLCFERENNMIDTD